MTSNIYFINGQDEVEQAKISKLKLAGITDMFFRVGKRRLNQFFVVNQVGILDVKNLDSSDRQGCQRAVVF